MQRILRQIKFFFAPPGTSWASYKWILQEFLRQLFFFELVSPQHSVDFEPYFHTNIVVWRKFYLIPINIILHADLVCFLDVSADVAAQRGEYGKEKYEEQTFQEKVRKNYMKLMEEDNWEVIKTDHKTLDQVYSEIEKKVNAVLKNDNKGPIEPLWPMQ